MNGITRVGISILLLGACAVAMRFTMYTVEVPEAQTQLHTARLDVSKFKRIKLKIETLDADSFYIKPSVAGRIAGTYFASIASGIRLVDATQSSSPQEKDTTLVQFLTGLNSSTRFLLNDPEIPRMAELRLPRGIPLSLEIIMPNRRTYPNLSIDLRGLEIQELSMPYGDKFNQLNIRIEPPKE